MFRKMKFATLMLIIILFCIHSAESAKERNFDDVLEKAIIFNEETKILLAEKFVPVQFMVPFPSYNFSLKPELNTLLRHLNDMWKLHHSSAHLISYPVLVEMPHLSMLIG